MVYQEFYHLKDVIQRHREEIPKVCRKFRKRQKDQLCLFIKVNITIKHMITEIWTMITDKR